MEFILIYSQYIILLPFILGIIRKQFKWEERKYLLFAIFLGVIAEVSLVVAIDLWRNNMPIVHFYTVFEFLLLSTVFYLGNPKVFSKKLYLITISIFTFLAIINTFFFQSIWVWNSNIRTLEGIILIFLSLRYFFILLKQLIVAKPEKTFMFWFSIAILVYFSGNLLLFIYSNQITTLGIESKESEALADQIIVINYILNILLYILYTVAFLCKEQKPFPKSSLSAP